MVQLMSRAMSSVCLIAALAAALRWLLPQEEDEADGSPLSPTTPTSCGMREAAESGTGPGGGLHKETVMPGQARGATAKDLLRDAPRHTETSGAGTLTGGPDAAPPARAALRSTGFIGRSAGAPASEGLTAGEVAQWAREVHAATGADPPATSSAGVARQAERQERRRRERAAAEASRRAREAKRWHGKQVSAWGRAA